MCRITRFLLSQTESPRDRATLTKQVRKRFFPQIAIPLSFTLCVGVLTVSDRDSPGATNASHSVAVATAAERRTD